MAIGVLGVGFTRRPYTQPSFAPSTAPYSPPQVATPPIVTGIEPSAYEAILFGKDKPLFVGGKGLLGGRIIEGPFWSGTQAAPLASYIIYHAEAANPSGTRTITDARLRGASVNYDGSGNLTDANLAGGNVTFRVGTADQLPFADSIGRYGAGAIAYRNGILSCWKNIPIAAFGGIIPMPSIEVSDSSFGDPLDGITRQDAIEVLLRYSRLDDDEFEVSVPGSDPCWIVGSKMTLLEFMQRMRSLFVHWNITYTDKLRIIDPTNFTIAIEITRANHARKSMRFTKTEPLIIPRKKNYQYIDKDRDFETNVVSAQEDIYPAPSTSSIDEETVDLPIVTTAAQATADVNVSLFEELAARSTMEATLLSPLFAAEAGDAARFADHDDINFVGRIMETQHDFETYQVDINTVEVLNCGASVADVGDCDVPDGATAFLSWVCDVYWIDGIFYTGAQITDGHAFRTAAGLEVPETTKINFIGDAFTVLTALENTIVIEFEQTTDLNINILTLRDPFDVFDAGMDVFAVQVNNSLNENRVSPAVHSRANFFLTHAVVTDGLVVAPSIYRVAITRMSDRLKVVTRNEGFVGEPTISPEAGAPVDNGWVHYNFTRAWVGMDSGTFDNAFNLRSITIYPTVDDVDLPDLTVIQS